MTRSKPTVSLLILLAIACAVSAQRPPAAVNTGEPAGQLQTPTKFPAGRVAASICTQWQQILRMRAQPQMAGRSIPAFEGLAPLCNAFQRNATLSLSEQDRFRLVTGLCQDWRRLQGLRGGVGGLQMLPALQEFATTCGDRQSAETLKYSCTSRTGTATYNGCCCLGALDCAWADRIGKCTSDCRGIKETCELVQKGTFKVLLK